MSLIVGIDPGKNSGMALISNGNTILQLETVRPWQVMEVLQVWEIEHGKISKVYMEDPRQNKPLFGKKGNKGVLGRIAQNVGSNKRDTDWLEHLITDAKYNLVLCRPTTEKWNAQTLKTITGYSGKSNSHTRDAIKLAYGR